MSARDYYGNALPALPEGWAFDEHCLEVDGVPIDAPSIMDHERMLGVGGDGDGGVWISIDTKHGNVTIGVPVDVLRAWVAAHDAFDASVRGES